MTSHQREAFPPTLVAPLTSGTRSISNTRAYLYTTRGASSLLVFYSNILLTII